MMEEGGRGANEEAGGKREGRPEVVQRDPRVIEAHLGHVPSSEINAKSVGGW
jgi:hypothetical protein